MDFRSMSRYELVREKLHYCHLKSDSPCHVEAIDFYHI